MTTTAPSTTSNKSLGRCNATWTTWHTVSGFYARLVIALDSATPVKSSQRASATMTLPNQSPVTQSGTIARGGYSWTADFVTQENPVPYGSGIFAAEIDGTSCAVSAAS